MIGSHNTKLVPGVEQFFYMKREDGRVMLLIEKS